MKLDLSFFKDKRILITGHTGFKGSWLSYILYQAGANVTGYSLAPPTSPSLFETIHLDEKIHSVIGDVRDLEHLSKVFAEVKPEIVIHLAAQPIVRESYKNPVYTYETNVMGTVNLCECVRRSVELGKKTSSDIDSGADEVNQNQCDEVNQDSYEGVKSFLNITTDKVYLNEERDNYGYQEDDKLDGFDPYSNSKSCSELVTHSYINSFFKELGIAVSTARAGNVIGGGDFAADRIIPDCFRAVERAYEESKGEMVGGDGQADKLVGPDRQGDKTTGVVGTIEVRNPYSTRPYQHVLEPLFIYLTIVKAQYENPEKAGYYNVGPDDCDCVNTGDLVDIFKKAWNADANEASNVLQRTDGSESELEGIKLPRLDWKDISETQKNAVHEANFLKLDSSKVKRVFGYQPTWHIDEALKATADWYKSYLAGEDVEVEMRREIEAFTR